MGMGKTLYRFNSSQDVVHLQTKYTLFKRVANIVFYLTLDEPLDRQLMREAIDRLIERNDCLRITFVKEGKEIRQFFADSRKSGSIPSVEFSKHSEMISFLNKFRKGQLNMFKSETLKTVFARDNNGKDVIIFKISHYVADTYAIGLLVTDLFGIYNALKKGTELPKAPGAFELLLQKSEDYQNNEAAVAKDEEFFKDYYVVKHPQHPMYCGIHGNDSDRWLKYKNKGCFYLPYLYVKCDTEGYRLSIPAAIVEKVDDWCRDKGITMSTFFFYAYSIAASLVNDRERYQSSLMLLDNRATLAERNCGGTRVQCLSVYTTVDYSKSFNENISGANEDLNQLYRHTKLSYLSLEAMQHKLWNYSIMSQVINFCYSFIPFTAPEGVHLQIYTNGKSSLVTYLALMFNTRTGHIDAMYDIQTEMVTPLQLMEFHNLVIRVTESVLANPDTNLSELFQ